MKTEETKHAPAPWEIRVYHNGETGATRIAIESATPLCTVASVHNDDMLAARLIAAATLTPA